LQDNKNTVIKLDKVVFAHRDRVICDQMSLQITRGQVTAILGPSGTGKTTLLRLIGGLIKPKAGSIEVLGQSVPQLSHNKLFELRKKMGLLFQSNALFTDMTVFDNVAFPIREHMNLSESLIHDIVLMKLEAVGLRGTYRLMPNELSGGMARRVALARAIALDPEIMMYDEPFTGQDPISMGVVVKLIRALNDALNLTSVIVSHDVQEVLSIADYVYIISGGKVIGEGTPQSIHNHPEPMVKQFIEGNPDGPVRFHYPAPSLQQDFRLRSRA
jgi:phospholipid/cholesterol/gamma-HCH transport system ATP-binding protein